MGVAIARCDCLGMAGHAFLDSPTRCHDLPASRRASLGDSPMLALIDYGSGNIRSVHNALQHEGAEVALVSKPEELGEVDGVVLPGVGHLSNLEAPEAFNTHVRKFLDDVAR